MTRSYLFLAEGFEEIEAITPIDVLRRAGIDVTTVSISESRLVRGAHGVKVEAEATLSEVELQDIEWLILPGGMPGATNLAGSEALSSLLKRHHSGGGKIAAICASPAVVLAPLGILKGIEATCYPSFDPQLISGGAIYRDRPVVALDSIITANGPSSALEFALAIVANTKGDYVSNDVACGMLLYKQPTDFQF